MTWAVFAALGTFGVLNALLGPALPYLRAMEQVGYLVGVLHQVAFAVGGGLAGTVAARGRSRARGRVIMVGLAGAAAAAVGIGYGQSATVTVAAAFVVSLLATSAMVRLWAVLADAHHRWRAVAMIEGEVAVSIGGIVAPVVIGGLAGTGLTWRFAFAVVAMLVLAATAVFGTVPVPAASPPPREHHAPRTEQADHCGEYDAAVFLTYMLARI